MEYRKLGASSLEVSVVGLGTWAIGNDFWGSVDDEESIRAIQAGLGEGMNLIDTAPAYGAGHSEEVVGKAIKGRRETAIIATKCGIIRTEDDFVRNLKPESLYKEIDDSLRRLGVDVIDLWQIHWPDPDTPLESSLEALQRIREQGKFRFLGVSNFDVQLMEKIRQIAEIVSLQPQYSLLERTIEDEILPYCRRTDIGILGYGTLAGGILSGKFEKPPEFAAGDNRADFYPYFHEPVFSEVKKLIAVLREIAREREKSVAQVVINWTIRQPGITTALVGARNDKQAAVNAGAGEFSLTDEELKRIDEAAASIAVGS